MYFIFVSNEIEAVRFFESVLHDVDSKKILVTLSNGFDLIQFLQNVKKGEAYPELIVLTPKYLRLSGLDLLELLKTDDIYRLIPVMMLLQEGNINHEVICDRLGTEFMIAPKDQKEWAGAVQRMCAACA